MLFKKLLRTMGLYKAQFISMIIMISLGIGVFVGFNMEWTSIEENTSAFFDKTGLADYQVISDSGFSNDQMTAVSKINGVSRAARFLNVSADVKEKDGDGVALSVTTDEKVSGFMLIKGEKYDKNSKDGIWLSDKYAEKNGIKLNDSLTLVYKSVEMKGKVKGLIKSGEHMICVRDESQLMPDYNTYGFAYISPEMYKTAMGGYDFYPQINVISNLSKKDFVKKVEKEIGKTTLILTKDENPSYSNAEGEAEEGKTMGSVLPVLFLLIAVLTMVTTMHRLTVKEKTQIGTLKALGFKDRKIILHYTSYAFMIGVVSTVIGVALGYGVAYYIMNPDGMMGTYFDMPEWKLCFPWFGYLVLGFIIAMLNLIGFLSVKKMLKGSAADALRPYTPKKMKAMLIERTKLFHKLPFGTRWNMRDIVRHKSRTAMSLIGIVGCMLLMVASLGMSDTMDAFLDLYYGGATNYSSRIFLAEDATAEQRKSTADKYKGDSSATVSVQIGEKAVSLDIYNIKHDKVRFPDKQNNYIKLGDDGAYICSRLSDEFDLEKGDKFTVSPYGSDDEYTLTVAGVTRSVSENIVITEKYAEKLNIPHRTDSVYTDTAKKDIEKSSAIKSVQSKQMIMDSFDTFMQLMDSMIYVLAGGALLLGVVVLYNLGVMSYTERYREMATLKVVGFKDKKIGKLLIGQNMFLSIVGVILGVPAGIGTLDYMLTALAGEYEMNLHISAKSIIISIALTFSMSLLVSLMVARKNKKIDMVEALKGAE